MEFWKKIKKIRKGVLKEICFEEFSKYFFIESLKDFLMESSDEFINQFLEKKTKKTMRTFLKQPM